MVKTAPNLGQQLSDIWDLIDNLSRENEDMGDLPIGPPFCELLRGPGRPYIVGEVVPSRLHFNYQGVSVEDARECPYCGITVYSTAAIGQTIGCLSCGRVFMWSNI